MDQEIIRSSFLQVGAQKPATATPASGDEIALFGIGVLSVFLVAARLEVTTRSEEGPRIEFSIDSLEDDFDLTEVGHDGGRGTRIRVHVKQGGNFDIGTIPMYVKKYARHVGNIEINDVDSGATTVGTTEWGPDGLFAIHAGVDDSVRSSRLGLTSGLMSQGGSVANRILLCNGGFFVESALDLLPLPALGFSGEIDIHPGTLGIVLSRERFQRDSQWAEFGQRLAAAFLTKAVSEMQSGSLAPTDDTDGQFRHLLLAWFVLVPSTPETVTLRNELEKRIFERVNFAFLEGPESTLDGALRSASVQRVYFRTANASNQVARQINDDGLPVNLQEEVNDGIRVGALKARGIPVLQARMFSLVQENADGAQSYNYDEMAHVVQPILSARGIDCRPLEQALPEDLDLTGIEENPALGASLIAAVPLRLVNLPSSTRRSVLDSGGVRYLNVAHPETRRLLRQIPTAHGNALRQQIVDVILHLEDHDTRAARATLLKLLEEPDLFLTANLQTTPLSTAALEDRVARLMKELGHDDA